MSDFPTRSVPAKDGSTILIPTLEATEGYSVGIYNFAGPGWNSTQGAMAARPSGTFDFAAKLHDLHWCICDIASFQPVKKHDEDVKEGKGDAVNRSLQHKADRIFRLMVEHNNNWGVAPWYSRTRFAHERTDWALPNDGFVNILNEPALCTVLNGYRMIPWTEVPRGDREYHEAAYNPYGGQAPRPNYAAPITQDETWYQWAKEFYGPIWGELISVV